MANPGVYIIGLSDCDEKVCAAAGRISTQEGTALEIFEKSHDKEKNRKLIGKVTKSGHTSTIEHIFFNLAFENVSVVVEQFMIEFRLASFTVKSRRYVDFTDCGYLTPEFICDEDKEKYTAVMDKMFSVYSYLTERDVPKEDARFVLPYCFYSNFLCSLNGREMVNVLTAMIYGRGKKIKEIYEIGLSLLAQCREYAPGVFTDFELRGEKYNDETEFDFPADNEKSSSVGGLCEILSVTTDGEKNIARCALIEKGIYSAESIEKIISHEENIREILRKLINSSRPRALESYNCTVRFNGVSLSTLTHFARHRVQSVCFPNLIKANRNNYVMPETVQSMPELKKVYTEAFEEMKALYEDFKLKSYDDNVLIYCVLSGNTVDFVTTMNAREMMLFFKLRSCTRAQWEIQDYAIDFLRKLRAISPDLFSLYGPSCYATGACPEGRMTCGKAAEIKEKFKSL
ncbi:MAG: FAD-dependent thymidylate synthase [Clostridia bacterium]|nr:FAD-dependent thymidylate synthase [Clostridia bacterium]